MSARMLSGQHPDKGLLFAAIDPAVRFTEPRLGDSRLAALLAPYPSEADARAALESAGAVLQ
ncbi:hypothetical protein SH591_08690 [Sphingomonas sp. LY54]|uniref:hypothetical protein n=1 Tax=Sphingomonas sp. LY54 TaxID=3095343 RepID=UPI002D77AAE3|nr:hypothetical protein [Sphingomonas sp. LY54]WRP27200.1 hypothetical protein SH591_08690 [Sphingomonas sp. LY54]